MPSLAYRGGWTADGVACPAPAVSTGPLGRWRFSLMLPDVTRRDGRMKLLFIGDDWAEGVRHEVACGEWITAEEVLLMMT